MVKTKRKGFTTVELVIVIAVIAIVIGAAIPITMSVVESAHRSNDIELADGVNEYLRQETHFGNTPEALCEVWDTLETGGIKRESFQAQGKGQQFYWDETSNVVVVARDGEIVYPENLQGISITQPAGDAAEMNAGVKYLSSSDGEHNYISMTISKDDPAAHGGYTENCPYCEAKRLVEHECDFTGHEAAVDNEGKAGHILSCAICGKPDANSDVEPHVEGDAATCLLGTKCSVCNAYYGKALGHDWNVLEKPEYASNDEHKLAWCTRCDAIQKEACTKGETPSSQGDINGHIYDCAKCDHGKIAEEHTWGEWTRMADKHYRLCTVCNYQDAHDLTNVTPATCTDKAYCDDCKTSYGEPRPHEYGNYIQENNQHYRKCDNCFEETQRENCYGGTATCIARAVCEVCKNEYGDGSEGHDWQDATCITPKTCKICNETEGEPSGHTYTNKFVEGTPEQGHKCICDVCGEISDEFFSHDYTWTLSDYDLNNKSYTHMGACPCGCETQHTMDIGDEAWIASGDSHTATCQTCKELVTAPHASIPATSEDACQKCAVCNEVTDSEHNGADEYSSDTNGHWNACIDCGFQVNNDTHTTAVSHENNSHTVYCTVCGYVVEENIDVAVVVKQVDSTCTEKGYKTYTKCNVPNCTHLFVEGAEIPAKGHTEEAIVAVEPTCTKPGSSAGTKCSVCGEILSATTAIIAPGHKEEAIPAVEPKCTTTGSTAGTQCSVCGEILVAPEPIPEKGHVDGEWIIDTDATCTGNGLKHINCTVCGAETKKETIPPKGHVDGEWITDKDATCTADGAKHQVCAVCNATIANETIPATGHTEEVIDAVAATCESAGSTEGKKCSVCGEILTKPTVIPKLNHDFNDWHGNTATCTEGGVQYRECQREGCGKTEERSTGALEHTWSGWKQSGNQHYKTCGRCGAEKDRGNCSGGEATCTERATCSTCGNGYGEKDPNNHNGNSHWGTTGSWNSSYYGKEHTHGNAGHMKVCPSCHMNMVQKNGNWVPDPNSSDLVEHTWIDDNGSNSAFNYNYDKHWHQRCSVCGHLKEPENDADTLAGIYAAPHQMGYQNNGSNERYGCALCGYRTDAYQNHSFGTTCDANHNLTCETCGYKKSAGTATHYQDSANGSHYTVCANSNCFAILSGYTRHDSNNIGNDGNGHWNKCSGCSFTWNPSGHNTSGGVGHNSSQHWAICSCGYGWSHGGHSGGSMSYNSSSHWGNCGTCGEKYGSTGHSMYWSGNTVKCSSCNYSISPTSAAGGSIMSASSVNGTAAGVSGSYFNVQKTTTGVNGYADVNVVVNARYFVINYHCTVPGQSFVMSNTGNGNMLTIGGSSNGWVVVDMGSNMSTIRFWVYSGIVQIRGVYGFNSRDDANAWLSKR